MTSPTPPQSLGIYKIITLIFFALTFITYAFFLDILIPGLPNDSYRYAVGFYLFMIPSLVLAAGQTMIGGFVTYMTVRTLSHDSQRIRMWQALAIAGFLTFLFSLTYAFFPYHGPLYYLAFVGGNELALPFEILWTLIQILSVGYFIKRMSNVKWKHGLFTAAFILLLIVVCAS